MRKIEDALQQAWDRHFRIRRHGTETVVLTNAKPLAKHFKASHETRVTVFGQPIPKDTYA